MAVEELEFVQWLSAHSASGGVVQVGIGDDMAVLSTPAGVVLVSSDMLLDGVHFDAKSDDLSLIGRKAVACSLSDCASMAVRPLAVTVSVAWCDDLDMTGARRIFEGMERIASEFDVAIVGGDTTSWNKPLAIDVAVTAVPYADIKPVLRRGAKVGDLLYVTGPLGGSRLGRHLSFTPRIREAKALAENLGDRLHAMIDISDGLSLDLSRMCAASGVGAVVDEEQLEGCISEDARRLAEEGGATGQDRALSDGEDFELLLAVAGEGRVPGVSLLSVGMVIERGLFLRSADGRSEPLAPKGYVH